MSHKQSTTSTKLEGTVRLLGLIALLLPAPCMAHIKSLVQDPALPAAQRATPHACSVSAETEHR